MGSRDTMEEVIITNSKNGNLYTSIIHFDFLHLKQMSLSIKTTHLAYKWT
jgi:hypothetical protein